MLDVIENRLVHSRKHFGNPHPRLRRSRSASAIARRIN